MIGKTIDQLKVGDTAEFAKTVSESDVYLFAGVTGDLNPAHINEEYARKTFFKTRIAHGGLYLNSHREQTPWTGHHLCQTGTELPRPGSHGGHHFCAGGGEGGCS